MNKITIQLVTDALIKTAPKGYSISYDSFLDVASIYDESAKFDFALGNNGVDSGWCWNDCDNRDLVGWIPDYPSSLDVAQSFWAELKTQLTEGK